MICIGLITQELVNFSTILYMMGLRYEGDLTNTQPKTGPDVERLVRSDEEQSLLRNEAPFKFGR